jgi:hypothetical protein
MWPEWNATAKDALLTGMFKDMVEKRIAREMNITPDMYVPIHYMSNPACVNALRNALCWYNFPKCDDLNRSLPLCESTCEEYYSNCKFKSLAVCEPSSYNSEGLFKSGVTPGPDQVLAKDREDEEKDTCKIVPTDKEIGITPEEKETPWYLTWYGLGGLIIIGMIVVFVLGYLLIPPVLMEYLLNATNRLLHAPLKFWMALPLFKGNKVLGCGAFVFVILVVVGMVQTVTGGFKRWDDYKETEEIAEYQFTPPPFIWGMQAITPLTNQQLRQLKNSCSCTGGAPRGLPSLATLIAALCWQWLRS